MKQTPIRPSYDIFLLATTGGNFIFSATMSAEDDD
jgi:hypothetical protein